MSSPVDNAELPKLPENQKSFAGIPEAVFVVSFSHMHDLKRLHNLKTIIHSLGNVERKKFVIYHNFV